MFDTLTFLLLLIKRVEALTITHITELSMKILTPVTVGERERRSERERVNERQKERERADILTSFRKDSLPFQQKDKATDKIFKK